jgi:hypothetical protein
MNIHQFRLKNKHFLAKMLITFFVELLKKKEIRIHSHFATQLTDNSSNKSKF